MLRWLIPAFGAGVLVWAVVLAFQGHFAVAFAIGIFAEVLLPARQASPTAKPTINTRGHGRAPTLRAKQHKVKPHTRAGVPSVLERARGSHPIQHRL